MTTPLLLAGSLISGLWLVHRANETFDSIRTCRYRELPKLSRKAEGLSMGYRLIGFASLGIPGGAVVTTAVFAYALYRRFR
jgi:hypothetical protein